jgi:hypothetical protein
MFAGGFPPFTENRLDNARAACRIPTLEDAT